MPRFPSPAARARLLLLAGVASLSPSTAPGRAALAAGAGRLRIQGYAGNSAPDHVDLLHALPELLGWRE